MQKRRGRDSETDGTVRTKHPQGPGDRKAKQGGCGHASLGCSQGHPPPGLWGQRCPSFWSRVPPVPGASTTLGSLALIRGLANGSEDWPVPGTLLNRDLGEIYS